MEDTEVSSRRTSPGRGGADEAVEKAPKVNTSVAEDLGEATPMTTNGGELHQSGSPPNTVPETNATLGLDMQPPSREGGGATTPSAASVNPKVAHALERALQSASVVEEHCTLMGVVLEKVQSAKSGLNEAFCSLMRYAT